jgi:urea transport system permease protein
VNAAVSATAELSAPRPEFVGPSPAGRLRSLYGGRGWLTLAVLLVVTAVILPSLYLVLPADHPFHVSAFWIALIGKIMCYAMLAVALDLVWGYTGILSLGHG